MTVAGECFPLSTWERRTSENAGGYWPTATATDSKSSRNATVKNRKSDGHSGVTLTDFVTLFPTPTASDSKRGEKGDKPGRQGGDSLAAAVQKWPTPRASDHKGADPIERRPACDDDLPTRIRRMESNLSEQIGGSLNPTFVEWLMGYPLEWTVLEPWAMAWFRPARGKRLKDSPDSSEEAS